jgi:lipid A ethanolaminephosphotransferase
MRKFSLSIKSHWFILGAAVYFTAALNLSFWRYIFSHLELSNAGVYVAMLSIPIILTLLLAVALSLFIWPYIGKPLLIALFTSAAVANYFMYKFGVFIDADMIRNVLETNPREALDLVSLSGLTWALGLGGPPSLLVVLAKIEYAPPAASGVESAPDDRGLESGRGRGVSVRFIKRI